MSFTTSRLASGLRSLQRVFGTKTNGYSKLQEGACQWHQNQVTSIEAMSNQLPISTSNDYEDADSQKRRQRRIDCVALTEQVKAEYSLMEDSGKHHDQPSSVSEKASAYYEYMYIMTAYVRQQIDTTRLYRRLATLFHGKPTLIAKLSELFPKEAEDAISTSEQGIDTSALSSIPNSTTNHPIDEINKSPPVTTRTEEQCNDDDEKRKRNLLLSAAFTRLDHVICQAAKSSSSNNSSISLIAYKDLPHASCDDLMDTKLPPSIATLDCIGPQCHGCGNFAQENNEMIQCQRCLRVAYCSTNCQKFDDDSPRYHSLEYCHPNLLSLAMHNIHNLDYDTKRTLMNQGKHEQLPNRNLNQTMAVMKLPSISKSTATRHDAGNVDMLQILQQANVELNRMRRISLYMEEEHFIQSPQGNCQLTYMDHQRWGLDVGVETLCVALNLWDGVYTFCSCSGAHGGTHHHDELTATSMETGDEINEETETRKASTKRQSWDPARIIYGSDSYNSLASIQRIVEHGSVGIQFIVSLPYPQMDTIGSVEGFTTIDCEIPGTRAGGNRNSVDRCNDCNVENEKHDQKDKSRANLKIPTKCRTMARQICYTPEPFDRLDYGLQLLGRISGTTAKYENRELFFKQRNLRNMVGMFSLGLDLLEVNPKLRNRKWTKIEHDLLEQLKIGTRALRSDIIIASCSYVGWFLE